MRGYIGGKGGEYDLMAGYSREIISYKQKAMERILNTDTIVSALKARDAKGNPLEIDELPYRFIFPFGYIPQTLEIAGCYITIEVSMPSVSTVNYFFKDVLMLITVICHQDLMQMTDEHTGATRIDYIAVELDKLFNNKENSIGTFDMELVSNTEGSVDSVHRYRQLRFKTKELRRDSCG